MLGADVIALFLETFRPCGVAIHFAPRTANQGILLYGMEGKKSVWNMEWFKYGMEDLMYGMEQIFHIPYKFHTCAF